MKFPVIRPLVSVLCLLCLCSCAHVFHAPSNAKLEASTARLSNAVTRATNAAERATTTAEHARAHVAAAEAAAKKEVVASESVDRQLDDLLKVLPPELKAKGEALKSAVAEDHSEVGEIVTNVYAAQQDHAQLAKDQAQLKTELGEATAAKQQVAIDKQEYYENADKLAATATKDSKALAWYRLHFFLGWAIFISGIVACIVFAIIKWGVKWGSKAARAAAKVESGGIL